MKRIRVLDLEDTSGVTDNDLEKIGKLLHSLKFLSVRGCREIRRLPDSISGLVQLHTLDVRDTSITTLPPAIIKLRELQYIRAGNSQQQLVIVSDSCTSTLQEDRVEAVADEVKTSRPSWSRSRAHMTTWVHSLLAKLYRHRDLGNGVKVPHPGIGKLTALHTIGVVNVDGGASGKAFLKELKKLTQLRKLGLSGVNHKNWHDLCSAISGHGHLESLSVRLNNEQDQCSLCDISKPPKTLKSLKLYGGNAHVSVAWMKQLGNLRKAHLQDLVLTISTQEDIDSLMELQCQDMYHRLCLKPVQDGELHYGRRERTWLGKEFSAAKILKIDCGSCRSKIVFGYCITDDVEVILVHCSTIEASLEVSGLDELCCLKEVRLEGFYSDALKQHLQQKIDELSLPRGVVLKLEDSSAC